MRGETGEEAMSKDNPQEKKAVRRSTRCLVCGNYTVRVLTSSTALGTVNYWCNTCQKTTTQSVQ